MLIYAQNVCGIPDWYKQVFSDFFAGAPLRDLTISMYQYIHIYIIYINKLKWGRQVDSGDELSNIASNSAYYQIHLAYVLLIFKIFNAFLYIDF
jgi:hypothetical protein